MRTASAAKYVFFIRSSPVFLFPLSDQRAEGEQKAEPESGGKKEPAGASSSGAEPAEPKPEEKKSGEAEPAAAKSPEPVKQDAEKGKDKKPENVEPKSRAPETKPEPPEQNPKATETKPDAAGAKPEEKKPETHSAPQFEFKKPTLVVNYTKHPNTSFTVGQIPLKAPDPHIVPESKSAPAKTFSAREKLHLDVSIATAKESSRSAFAQFISLNRPAKKSGPAPVRKAAARKDPSKRFRPSKPLKLQVKVSTAAPQKAPAVRPASKRKTSGGGSAPAKKGK